MMNRGDPGSVPHPDGLVLAPFRALRYDPDRVHLADVIAPPYDVIDTELRDALAGREAHNVVGITLPLDDDGPQSRYAVAARLLAAWRADGTLVAEAEPSLYVYEQSVEGHVQRGLVGAIGLTPAADEIVLPHENTMAGPVADRLALMESTAADLEPIFLVYDGGGAASRLVAEVDTQLPVIDVAADDGVRHRVWAVREPETLRAVAADLHDRKAVIADGHHRYATFLRHQADRHAAGEGPGPWDFGLAFLVDGTAFGPQVQAIHRAVPGLPPEEAARRAGSAFTVTEVAGDLTAARDALQKAGVEGTAFILTDGSRSWLLSDPEAAAVAAAAPPGRSAAWRALDVAVAHSLLIATLWGLDDNESVVEFHHDADSAVAAARRTDGLALLLNPTPVADVAAVAAAGDRMPRKSTLFVPKPATGLLIRSFADA